MKRSLFVSVMVLSTGQAGVFTARVRFLEGGQGGRISLLDRGVNPTDLVACRRR